MWIFYTFLLAAGIGILSAFVYLAVSVVEFASEEELEEDLGEE